MNMSLATEKMIRKEGYILEALDRHCLNGDVYVSEEALFGICKKEKPDLNYEVFSSDLAELFRLKLLIQENHRIYLTKIWRYEESAAEMLSRICRMTPLPQAALPIAQQPDGVTLCQEQREAVQMALSNRLSLILGGAGSGKSTLIRGIVSCSGVSLMQTVICAPTGKAARNLSGCTALPGRAPLPVRTVHSALGLRPNEDFLSPVKWGLVRLVIVDEASMLTLEMLAGILSRVSDDCRIVLVGDDHQLLSVGAGDVMADLQDLDFPCRVLQENHRQSQSSDGLIYNVTKFPGLCGYADLKLDSSMQVVELDEDAVQGRLVDEAYLRYRNGESVQVLSPYNSKGPLSAAALNVRIRDAVNPLTKAKAFIRIGGKLFVDRDRVLITQNDRNKNVSNGDVGVLRIHEAKGKNLRFSIELPDGRKPAWAGEEAYAAIHTIQLAYALTVHKSQGSEYDMILMPATMSMTSMLSRNLLYTAISRAKQHVKIFGSCQAVDHAMQYSQPPRQSMLAAKTRLLTHIPA